MLFFIIDYRGMSRKACMFFSSDYAFYKFNFVFVFFRCIVYSAFFAAYFIQRSLSFHYIYLQKIYQKNFLKKYAKTLDKLFFTNYNMGEFSNQSERVLTFKNKECQTFRTVSESRALR